MTTVTDDQLLLHASRVQGKVVVITGASSGIGKAAAILFAQYGAKVVIGDVDVKGAEATVAKIIGAGGEAIAQTCNVLNWEDQVSLFQSAMSVYGSVDIVFPNAGIMEALDAERVHVAKGRPLKPKLKALEINLIGVIYTSHLAKHYLRLNYEEGSLKALILMGSSASWNATPNGPMYSSSKHGVLGYMRSIYSELSASGIRTGSIHPWLADTPLVPFVAKILMAGLPKTPVSRIAQAVLCAGTNPDEQTSGCAWILPDHGPVLRIERDMFKLGVYDVMDERNKSYSESEPVAVTSAAVRDLVHLLGTKIFFTTLGLTLVWRLYKIGVLHVDWNYFTHSPKHGPFL